MKVTFLILTFAVLVAVNEALPGPWIPLWTGRWDVWRCATVAAKALKGNFAFVKWIWWAGGRNYKPMKDRFTYYRVAFSVGPWKRKNCIAFCVWPKNFKWPYITKRWPTLWGKSYCWPKK